MAEWKRIFRNRRLCVGLLLIFLLNGFLFVREQVEMDYGLDYTLPQTSISISTIGGSYEVAQETVDSREALTRYLEWLEEYKKLPLADAIPKLESEKERLTDSLTIPLLSNTTFFLTVTGIISSFQTFGYVNVMTKGGPVDSTYVLVFYIYKLAFDYMQTGYASAVAVVLFLILLVITIIQYTHNNKEN